MASQLSTQPPKTSSYILSYPAPYVLLITINRPTRMNSLPYASHWEADSLMQWFDAEPSLRVVVVTGAGEKAFCAGQDLIEQGEVKRNPQARQMMTHPPNGFMGISRRVGKKPVIAAVNGFALGGGFEIVLGWYVHISCME
jgi:enoyl-CoA hydratase/carnithine racemase